MFSTVYIYLNEVYERYRLTTWNISVFSLFSVVQFKNTGCKSQSAMTSGQRYSQLTLITFELIKIPLWFPMTQVTDFHFSTVRNGTCYTSSECTSKGGTASFFCNDVLISFGVCCLFLVTTTGATINQNCTYLRNPSFPSVYSTTSSLSYTVSKCSTGKQKKIKDVVIQCYFQMACKYWMLFFRCLCFAIGLRNLHTPPTSHRGHLPRFF